MVTLKVSKQRQQPPLEPLRNEAKILNSIPTHISILATIAKLYVHDDAVLVVDDVDVVVVVVVVVGFVVLIVIFQIPL